MTAVERPAGDVARVVAPGRKEIGGTPACPPENEKRAFDPAVAVGPVVVEVDADERADVLAGGVNRRRVAEAAVSMNPALDDSIRKRFR